MMLEFFGCGYLLIIILNNCSQYIAAIKDNFPNVDEDFVARVHFEQFAKWFKEHVSC